MTDYTLQKSVKLLPPEELSIAEKDALENRIYLGGDVAMQAYREIIRRVGYIPFIEERNALLRSQISYSITAIKHPYIFM
jgi:hypothetical protein